MRWQRRDTSSCTGHVPLAHGGLGGDLSPRERSATLLLYFAVLSGRFHQYCSRKERRCCEQIIFVLDGRNT